MNFADSTRRFDFTNPPKYSEADALFPQLEPSVPLFFTPYTVTQKRPNLFEQMLEEERHKKAVLQKEKLRQAIGPFSKAEIRTQRKGTIEHAMRQVDVTHPLGRYDRQTVKDFLLRNGGSENISQKTLDGVLGYVRGGSKQIAKLRERNLGLPKPKVEESLMAKEARQRAIDNLPFTEDSLRHSLDWGLTQVQTKKVDPKPTEELPPDQIRLDRAIKLWTTVTGESTFRLRLTPEQVEEQTTGQIRNMAADLDSNPHRNETAEQYAERVRKNLGQMVMHLAGNPNSIDSYPIASGLLEFLGGIIAQPIDNALLAKQFLDDPRKFLEDSPERINGAFRALNVFESGIDSKERTMRALGAIATAVGGWRLLKGAKSWRDSRAIRKYAAKAGISEMEAIALAAKAEARYPLAVKGAQELGVPPKTGDGSVEGVWRSEGTSKEAPLAEPDIEALRRSVRMPLATGKQFGDGVPWQWDAQRQGWVPDRRPQARVNLIPQSDFSPDVRTRINRFAETHPDLLDPVIGVKEGVHQPGSQKIAGRKLRAVVDEGKYYPDRLVKAFLKEQVVPPNQPPKGRPRRPNASERQAIAFEREVREDRPFGPEAKHRSGDDYLSGREKDTDMARLRPWKFLPPTLETITKRIRYKNKEHLVVFLKDGGGVLHKVGGTREVGYHRDDHGIVKDATTVHNHPQNGGPSPQDFRTAANLDLAEFRVVTRDGYLYRCVRPARGWPKGDELFTQNTIAQGLDLDWMNDEFSHPLKPRTIDQVISEVKKMNQYFANLKPPIVVLVSRVR